jgi:hypothetical protein
VPIFVKVLLAVGLLAGGGILVAVPMLGMRSEVGYERRRIRERYSTRDRRIFWSWAIAFPVAIVAGCLLGVLFHPGQDWFTSELIGAGIAAAVAVPATWIVQAYLARRPPRAATLAGDGPAPPTDR